MIRVRFFAGAAEAAGTESAYVSASTLGELRSRLVEQHGAAFGRILGRCSVLVNGVRSEHDATALADDDTIDVLPPFAGG